MHRYSEQSFYVDVLNFLHSSIFGLLISIILYGVQPHFYYIVWCTNIPLWATELLLGVFHTFLYD